MTKRKTHLTCIGCGAIYPRPDKRRVYCSIVCHFWSHVNKTKYCWNWTGSTHQFGYGEFRNNSKLYRSHRFSYEIHKGEIPEGYGINHHCDNPKCVNPDHLYAGTQLDNTNDPVRRDRIGSRKLTKEQVYNIKLHLFNRTSNAYRLSKIFNVSQCSVWNIQHNKTWKHVTL